MTSSLHARISIAIVAAATAAVSALAYTGRLPLGIPGQWQWGRIDLATPLVDHAAAAMAAIFYAGFVMLGGRWASATPGRRSVALLLLVAAGFAVQVAIQTVGYGLEKWPFVLVSRSSSGYYTAAREEVRSADEFLRHYDDIQIGFARRFGPFHLATHPPGLVLWHYGSMRWCERSPGLTRLLLALEPQSVRDGFRAISRGAIAPAHEASIWLVALLSQLASALTVLPIFMSARRGLGSSAAWFAAALWPLTPAVTVFMPKSDVLYPLVAATAVALSLSGTGRTGRWASGLLAGFVLWIGLFLSFALVSIVFLIGMAILLSRPDDGWRARFERVSAIAAGFLAVTLLCWLATEYNQIATLVRCFEIHKTFYDAGRPGADRSYWPWVGFNVLEFAVATGLPVIGAALVGMGYLWRRTSPESPAEPAASQREVRSSVRGLMLAWCATLIVLNLSGKNLGEIARLWMLLMPFASVGAAAAIERWGGGRWPAMSLLVLQAAQTILLAASVQGFFDPASLTIPVPSHEVIGRG